MNEHPTAPATATENASPVWTLRDVTLRGQTAPRLDRVSVVLPAGRVGLLGVSGAGKSSLLRLLAGFETADSGKVTHHSADLASALPVFWAPQDYGLWPHLTVEEHLEHVRPAEMRSGLSVAEWLKQFRLESLATAHSGELSEGEQSRLSVVRALASEADVLLLDEPLAHVDPVHRDADWRAVMNHAAEFCRGVVFATHEPSNVRGFADYVVCLDRGRVQFAGSLDELLYSPPDRTAAWLLGPCNWLEDETRRLFPEIVSGWSCLRPEETFLAADLAGPFQVTQIEDRGTGSCIELREVESSAALTVYATQSPKVQNDSRVTIEVVPASGRA